eukprot:gene2749-3044_t
MQVLGESSVQCPDLDIAGGFQKYFDKALGKSSSPAFDPFKNDINFLLATWSLEEIGATGDKGCILLVVNPGVSNAISGLATSASYQSGVDRHHLWQRRNETLPEYNMTVQEVVLAISNLRDELDGPPEDDQGLTNSNPNFIAVPAGNINLVPTDLRGLTFSRTPQQVLRILTLGSPDGVGAFFPKGFNGRINKPTGYDKAANAKQGYPGNKIYVKSLQEVGKQGLIGNNIVVVSPELLGVQQEASGFEYVKPDSLSPDFPKSPNDLQASAKAAGAVPVPGSPSYGGKPAASKQALLGMVVNNVQAVLGAHPLG